MRVNTLIVIDIETGAVERRESFWYRGPVERCDRSTQAQGAADSSAVSKGAAGIGSYLTPQLESWGGGAAPGYGQSAVNQMTAAAQTAAGAAANQAKQGGLLSALRTENAAGVGAQDVAAAVGSGQNQTQAVEDILGQNAQLKAQQQTGALNMLGSMYGTDVGAQAGLLNATTQAGTQGWFQNMLSGINAFSPMAVAKICWIAAALYGGWEDERTILLRAWIFGPFRRRWYGRPPTWAYRQFGERLAAAMARRPWLEKALRTVFDAALRQAQAWLREGE